MYTSIKISKLIQAKVPGVKTKQYHQHTQGRGNDSIVTSLKTNKYFEYFPAYNLADVIKAIKVHYEAQENETRAYWKCYDLIHVYLPTLSLQSKEVEDLLTNIFE